MDENQIILIDKPAGISSFGVVAKVRAKLRDEFGHKVKVGHTGTLDPFATGLLILLTGKMTKKSSEFLKLDKIYEATLKLGFVSTTGDPEGEIKPYDNDVTAPEDTLSRNKEQIQQFSVEGLIGGTAEIEGACPVTTGASDPSRDNTSSDSRILPIFTKSEEALDYICHDQTVILDPPRAGCDKKLIEKLNETKPTTIIYLSCNPATQARDIKQLLGNYHIKHITTYNFFPHTPHIENLVILSL